MITNFIKPHFNFLGDYANKNYVKYMLGEMPESIKNRYVDEKAIYKRLLLKNVRRIEWKTRSSLKL